MNQKNSATTSLVDRDKVDGGWVVLRKVGENKTEQSKWKGGGGGTNHTS